MVRPAICSPCWEDNIDGVHIPVTRDLLHEHLDIRSVPIPCARLGDRDLRGSKRLADRQSHNGGVIIGYLGCIQFNLRVKGLRPQQSS